MSNSNGKITKPVTTSYISQVLGVASRNVGYLCSNLHGRINMWARYKPVCLPTKSKNDTFNNGTGLWNEADSDVSSWDRAWFYGTPYYPVYTVPVISSLNDLGSDGVPNEYSMWAYNPPFGGEDAPCRMTDFLGYNHNASLPLYVRMNDEIIINGTYETVIEEWGTDKNNGEWEMSDILKMLNTTTQVYAGIAIRNITRGVLVGYVKTQPLTADDAESGVFRLNPSSGSTIANGGFGHKVYDGDVIDIFTFLSTSPGETDVDSMMKYSVYLDKESECYMRYTVGHKTIIVTVNYVFQDVSHNILEFSGGKSYYINDNDYGGDGNIFKASSYIQALYGKLIVDKTANSDYSNFNVFLSGDCIGTRADGGIFQTQAVPNITYLTKTNGSFNSANFQYTLNGTEGMQFVGYNSLRDAQAQANGVQFTGCPIYDSIEDNYSDADNVGVLSNRKIKLLCSAISSKQYYMIKMASKDNNNIIADLQ